MNKINEPLSFSIPLTFLTVQAALKLSQTQPNLVKQRQVFLNCLAVQVVHYYCQCLGLDTKLDTKDINYWINQSLLDVADLTLATGDKLECRPILPNEDVSILPLEVQSERAGYLLVEIDEDHQKGTILGFSLSHQEGIIHRSQLQSLESFLIFCQRFILTPREYLEQLFNLESDWTTPEQVLVPDYRRGTYLCAKIPPSQTDNLEKIRHAKIVELNQRRFALIIHLTWQSTQKISVYTRLQPMDSIKSLPLDLTISFLDAFNEVLVQKSAKIGDNCLRLSHDLPDNHQLTISIFRAGEKIIKHIGLKE